MYSFVVWGLYLVFLIKFVKKLWIRFENFNVLYSNFNLRFKLKFDHYKNIISKFDHYNVLGFKP